MSTEQDPLTEAGASPDARSRPSRPAVPWIVAARRTTTLTLIGGGLTTRKQPAGSDEVLSTASEYGIEVHWKRTQGAGPKTDWVQVGVSGPRPGLESWVRSHGASLARSLGVPAISWAAALVATEGIAENETDALAWRRLEWATELPTRVSVGRTSVRWYGSDVESWADRAQSASTWIVAWPQDRELTTQARATMFERVDLLDEGHWLAADHRELQVAALATSLSAAEARRSLGTTNGMLVIVRPSHPDEPVTDWLRRTVDGLALARSEKPRSPVFTPVARVRAELTSGSLSSPQTQLPAIFESFIRLLGSIYLAALGARATAGELPPLDVQTQTTLGSIGAGTKITMGFGVKIMRDLESKVRAILPPILTSLGSHDALQRLQPAKDVRNDISHLRNSYEQISTDVGRLQRDLESLMDALSNVGSSLLYIENVTPSRGQLGSYVIIPRPLVGPYPVLGNNVLLNHWVAKGLWVSDSSGDALIPLDPWVRWLECPVCGVWDLFSLVQLDLKPEVRGEWLPFHAGHKVQGPIAAGDNDLEAAAVIDAVRAGARLASLRQPTST